MLTMVCNYHFRRIVFDWIISMLHERRFDIDISSFKVILTPFLTSYLILLRKQLEKNNADDELQYDLNLAQKTVTYIQELELGHVEYAIARCVLFLNPLIGTSHDGVVSNEKIEKLQSEMVSKLGDLISLQRKEKILLRINLSKQIHKKSLEVSKHPKAT